MHGPFFKFLCCLAVGLQVWAAMASAQGLVVCRPSDGTVHVEDRGQGDDCRRAQANPAMDETPAATGDSPSDCVDLPVGDGGHASVRSGHSTSPALNPVQCLAVLPLCLQVSLDPSSIAVAPLPVERTAAVPDAMLDSLGSVILVV